jgi:DNA-binding CsgD family transcriptional regulator/DNA-binding MarR family transcriptional regulator
LALKYVDGGNGGRGEALVLEALGVDPDVEAVYRLLLDQPSWDVEAIAASLGQTTTRVSRALDALVDLGLVRVEPDDTARLRPVHPQLALPALLARVEMELHARTQQVEAIREAVADLASSYSGRAGYAPDVIERHDGLVAVRARLTELAMTARHECLSFLTGGAQKPDTMDASKPLDQQALERGVLIRNVYQDSFRNDPATVAYVRWLSSLGALTRTVPTLPLLLVIVDRKIALVPVDPANGRAGALELRSPGAVAAMCALFEQVWAHATPFGVVRRNDATGLTAQEQHLLRMLADGATDEMVGRALGVSMRTVARMTSDLMKRLDARSRFEAGVQAARQNWI